MFLVTLFIGILSLLLIVSLYLKNRTRKNETPTSRPIRRGGRRMRETTIQENEDENLENPELEELRESGIKVPEGKIGKKKLEKLQSKANKKKAREDEVREREEKKKKYESEEVERIKMETEEKEREKREKEEKEREKEEKEKRETEEYLSLKGSFELVEEGFDETSLENPSKSNNNTLQSFIDYIKASKIVLLEDLGAHFRIKTPDVILRIQTLLNEDRLSGVIDDRGKFIYISMEELGAFAEFIRQRGRVSISELAESSHKLITLDPEIKA